MLFVAGGQDARNGNGDVYGARISTTGAVEDPAGFVLSSASSDEGDATLVAGAPGQALLGYRRYAGPPYTSERVFVRFVSPTVALGASCVTSDDCGGGPCVDSVCCDTTCGGGASDDCQACSVAAGAAVDGTCGPVKAGNVCRAALGVCDVAEACDGTCLTCPTDAFAADGVALAWAILRGRDEATTQVIVRVEADPARYRSLAVTGVDPFTQRTVALQPARPLA